MAERLPAIGPVHGCLCHPIGGIQGAPKRATEQARGGRLSARIDRVEIPLL